MQRGAVCFLFRRCTRRQKIPTQTTRHTAAETTKQHKSAERRRRMRPECFNVAVQLIQTRQPDTQPADEVTNGRPLCTPLGGAMEFSFSTAPQGGRILLLCPPSPRWEVSSGSNRPSMSATGTRQFVRLAEDSSSAGAESTETIFFSIFFLNLDFNGRFGQQKSINVTTKILEICKSTGRCCC